MRLPWTMLLVGFLLPATLPGHHDVATGRERDARRALLEHRVGVRTRVDEVSVLGRNTQGVKLIRLREGERLVGMERVEDEE